MTKYRKKPLIIDAVVWDGDEDKMEAFMTIDWGIANEENDLVIWVDMERRIAKLGDYVIRSDNGEFRVYNSRLFPLMHEAVT